MFIMNIKMDKVCNYLRGVNIKKAAFGSPSLLSLIFTLFVSFEYITGFIAELYQVKITSIQSLKDSLFLTAILLIIHLFFVTMIIWSLMMVLVSDPGYIDE